MKIYNWADVQRENQELWLEKYGSERSPVRILAAGISNGSGTYMLGQMANLRCCGTFAVCNRSEDAEMPFNYAIVSTELRRTLTLIAATIKTSVGRACGWNVDQVDHFGASSGFPSRVYAVSPKVDFCKQLTVNKQREPMARKCTPDEQSSWRSGLPRDSLASARLQRRQLTFRLANATALCQRCERPGRCRRCQAYLSGWVDETTACGIATAQRGRVRLALEKPTGNDVPLWLANDNCSIGDVKIIYGSLWLAAAGAGGQAGPRRWAPVALRSPASTGCG
uniref:Uncharacterized protein n=1 Tax=Trichuris muris TaxID=70415 RepID=A0A5S6QD59_TRIMR